MEKKSTRIRREEIVQAALKVVGERGLRALTISAIATEAGMSEANIYRHYSGKDAIFTAIADFIGHSVMGKAAVIAAGSRTPLEKLETVFFSHLALIAEHPGIPRFVFSEDVLLAHPEVAQTLAARINGYVETIAGIIAAGMHEGQIRLGISSRETALALLGMIQFTALRSSMGGLPCGITDEGKLLWQNFSQLLR